MIGTIRTAQLIFGFRLSHKAPTAEASMEAISLTATIGKSRRISIDLPPDIPQGKAQLLLVISSEVSTKTGARRKDTASALLGSKFFGTWRKRDDIGAGVAFARALRRQAQERRHA